VSPDAPQAIAVNPQPAHSDVVKKGHAGVIIEPFVRLEIMGLKTSATEVSRDLAVQAPLAFALLVPLAATIGQYWTSGYWRDSLAVGVLFWPGAAWKWTVQMNAAVVIGVIGALYVWGIVRLLRERTLAVVMALCIGGTIVAVLAGKAVNHFTGWSETQMLGSIDMTGRVNWYLLAHWHNPVWEEAVFRGLPLLGYAWLMRRRPIAARWGYLILPAVAFAAYHVPGHGYARVTDTFILGAIFAGIALRYGFWSVLVLHCILDAVSVLSLGHLRGAPPEEVRWLAEHFGALNTTFTLALMGTMAMAVYVWLRSTILTRKRASSRSTLGFNDHYEPTLP
jgi:hypothetical protein